MPSLEIDDEQNNYIHAQPTQSLKNPQILKQKSFSESLTYLDALQNNFILSNLQPTNNEDNVIQRFHQNPTRFQTANANANDNENDNEKENEIESEHENQNESNIDRNRHNMLFSDSEEIESPSIPSTPSPPTPPSPSSQKVISTNINKKRKHSYADTRKHKRRRLEISNIINNNINNNNNNNRHHESGNNIEYNNIEHNESKSISPLSPNKNVNANKPLKRRSCFRRKKSLHQQENECEINIHQNVSQPYPTTTPTPTPTPTPKATSIQSLKSPPSLTSKSDAKSPSTSLPPSSSPLSVLTPLQTLQSVQNKAQKSSKRKKRLRSKIDVYNDDYCNRDRDHNHNHNMANKNNNNYRRLQFSKRSGKVNTRKKKRIHKKIKRETKKESDEEVIKYFYELVNKKKNNENKENEKTEISDNINGIHVHQCLQSNISQRTRRAKRIRKTYNEQMIKEYDNLEKTSIVKDGRSVDLICLD